MIKKSFIFVICLILALAAFTACDSGNDEPTVYQVISISLNKSTFLATDEIIISIKNNTSAAAQYTDEVMIYEVHGDHVHGAAEWKSSVNFSTELKTLEAQSEATQTIKLQDLKTTLSSGTYQLSKLIGATEYTAIFTIE